ncbi:MAG: hypothetical protein DRI73_06615 [Bacteroidetes bacterium]|nr:MAG: hypothetical protein DRI73_06615 [Bacteroidota bacterium]
MPFAFFNKDSMLVGYGIDLAHHLAADLGVSIEFVPVKTGMLVKEMDQDHFDIVMSDIFISGKYAEELELSKPYLNVSLALFVSKENHNFDDFNSASELDTFTIAYIVRKEIAEEFLSFLPNGGSYPISDISEFLNRDKNDTIQLDAYLTSAERAASLTVFYPDYKVVNPLPYHINNALVFPIARDDVWNRYIDKWIDFRTKDGTFQRIYDQWILGHKYEEKQESWSFYENVIREKWLSKNKKKQDKKSS